jgi:hypothetical protein
LAYQLYDANEFDSVNAKASKAAKNQDVFVKILKNFDFQIYYPDVELKINQTNTDLIQICNKMVLHLGVTMDTSLFFRGQHY